MQAVRIIETLMALNYFDHDKAYFKIKEKFHTISTNSNQSVFIAMLKFKGAAISLANEALKRNCKEISAEIRESISLLNLEINKSILFNSSIDEHVLTENL